MNKIVNISNDKKSVLEFDIEVIGAVEDEMAVRFIIESEGMVLGFESKREKGDTWSVEIPAMKILDKTVYPFYISVIVDGYTFEGLRGSVNVIGERKIHVSDPVLVPATVKKRIVKKAEPKEETKATVIKPKKKTIGTPPPLKVKDGAEILKTLSSNKPKAAPKKAEPLDDKTIELINKAKEEKKNVSAKKEDKKPVSAKKEDSKKVTPKKQKPTVAPVVKKDKPKNKVTEEIIVVPTDIPTDIQPETTHRFSAKTIAQDLIKSVTGIGNTKKDNVNEGKNKKVKDILKDDLSDKKEIRTKPSRKKVIRGNDILEVNTKKEDDIKKILDEEEIRSVTTTPINKKLH